MPPYPRYYESHFSSQRQYLSYLPDGYPQHPIIVCICVFVLMSRMNIPIFGLRMIKLNCLRVLLCIPLFPMTLKVYMRIRGI